MRALVLIFLTMTLLACEESSQKNAQQTQGTGNELTIDEQNQQQDVQNEAEKIDEEMNKFTAEVSDAGLTDPNSLTIVPTPRPLPYFWYRALLNRLKFLDSQLDKTFKAYQNLPEKLQRILKPWMILHFKHLHSRLDLLKERIAKYFRKAFDHDFCIMVADIEPTRPMPGALVAEEINQELSNAKPVLQDEDGVAYCEIDANPVRPYICVPDGNGGCQDICTDNLHLVKRLVNFIEDIQRKIERMVEAL